MGGQNLIPGQTLRVQIVYLLNSHKQMGKSQLGEKESCKRNAKTYFPLSPFAISKCMLSPNCNGILRPAK